MMPTPATQRKDKPNFCVVFVGNIPCDVEAEDEAAAVRLARSLCEFRTDDGRFTRGVLAILKLDEQGNVIREPKK